MSEATRHPNFSAAITSTAQGIIDIIETGIYNKWRNGGFTQSDPSGAEFNSLGVWFRDFEQWVQKELPTIGLARNSKGEYVFVKEELREIQQYLETLVKDTEPTSRHPPAIPFPSGLPSITCEPEPLKQFHVKTYGSIMATIRIIRIQHYVYNLSPNRDHIASIDHYIKQEKSYRLEWFEDFSRSVLSAWEHGSLDRQTRLYHELESMIEFLEEFTKKGRTGCAELLNSVLANNVKYREWRTRSTRSDPAALRPPSPYLPSIAAALLKESSPIPPPKTPLRELTAPHRGSISPLLLPSSPHPTAPPETGRIFHSL